MSRVEELENEIKGLENRKIELLKELEVEKQKTKTKIEYQLKNGDNYWYVGAAGVTYTETWTNQFIDRAYYKQGNIFLTEKEAQREIERRDLLTRFRQFRDKCNGDWKPEINDCKYFISYDGSKNVLESGWNDVWDNFNTFGYFYDERDCLHAIELFGDEIKRLYVEG